MSDDWKNNIPLRIRTKVFLRDWYIRNIRNPYQSFRRKQGLADKDLFKHIKIQTNYMCTRKCSFCHYGLERSPVKQNINEKLFKRIINELASISYSGILSLYEINEPLTDKRFNEFLKYARKKLPRAWIFITTNGDLLTTHRVSQLFHDGLNHIYLNSYDDKACERNLNMLSQLDDSLVKKITHINRTYQETWTSRAGNVKQFYKEVCQAPCDQVYEIMYIKPSGMVCSCINDFYNMNEMGDLNKASLFEVWFGTKFQKMRRELSRQNRNCSDLCRVCDYVGYGNLPKVPFFWKIKSVLHNFNSKKSI